MWGEAYLTFSLGCLIMLSMSFVKALMDELKSSFSRDRKIAVVFTMISGDLLHILIRTGFNAVSNSSSVSASIHPLKAETFEMGTDSRLFSTCETLHQLPSPLSSLYSNWASAENTMARLLPKNP